MSNFQKIAGHRFNDGAPDSGGTFGLVTSARDPRILQIGAEFLF